MTQPLIFCLLFTIRSPSITIFLSSLFFYSFLFCRPLSLIIRCIIVSFCSRCTIFFIMFFSLSFFTIIAPICCYLLTHVYATQHYHVMTNPFNVVPILFIPYVYPYHSCREIYWVRLRLKKKRKGEA